MERKEPWVVKYFEVEFEQLLRVSCDFCLRYWLYQCACHGGNGKENEFMNMIDENLPY